MTTDPQQCRELCATLTPRQLDTLRAICLHGTDKRAAKALGITHRTIENHLRDVRAKLGDVERTQAAVIAALGGVL